MKTLTVPRTLSIYPESSIDFILIPQALEENYDLLMFNEELECFELELEEDENPEEVRDLLNEALSETTATYRIEL